MRCKHNNFIESLGDPQSNREYWLITEIFVYLHNGKDYCDCKECPDCWGSGWETQFVKPCGKCNGTGIL